MDDQNFDDIIKGKLENYQDTSSFDEGALDQMLDNLPTSGGAIGGSGLPAWAQSAWLPVGLVATLLFNVVLLAMVWQQKQTINEVKQTLDTVQAKTPVMMRDTVVIVQKDTVYIQNNGGVNQASILGAGYSFYPSSRARFRNHQTPHSANYPATPPQSLPRGKAFSQQNTQPNKGNPPTSVRSDSLSLINTKNGQGVPPTTSKTNKKRLSAEEKQQIIASLSVDSIQPLAHKEEKPVQNTWSINMEKVTEPTIKNKKKKYKPSVWNNVGIQLGVSAGVASPMFNWGKSNKAIPIGAKAEIGFGERLRLYTGVDFYSLEHELENFPVNVDYDETFPEVKTDQELEEIKTKLSVLELPIQFRYMLGSRFSSFKPFVGLGIVARKLTNYQTFYKYEDDDENELYSNSTIWSLSHYQAVLGGEFFLKRNLSLQLHAHYTGRFSESYNNLGQFNSLGLNATLLFRIK